jgi:hypothetical protein
MSQPAPRAKTERRLAEVLGSGTTPMEVNSVFCWTAVGVLVRRLAAGRSSKANDWRYTVGGTGATETVRTSSAAVE